MHFVRGVAYTFLFTLVFAVLAAAMFRFPVPFAGVIGPAGEGGHMALSDRVVAAAYAWVFYSVVSFGLVQTAVGAALGFALGRSSASQATAHTRTAAGAAVASLVLVLAIATLDWVIGTW